MTFINKKYESRLTGSSTINGSTDGRQRLSVGYTGVYPITVGLWYYRTLNAQRTVWSVSPDWANYMYRRVHVTSTGRAVAYAYNSGGGGAAGKAVPLKTWAYATAIFVSRVDRSIYTNGRFVAKSTVDANPTGDLGMGVGGRVGSSPAEPYGGRIAGLHVMKHTMPDDEILAVANGDLAPYDIPGLDNYWPLTPQYALTDIIGSLSFNSAILFSGGDSIPPQIYYGPPGISLNPGDTNRFSKRYFIGDPSTANIGVLPHSITGL